MKEVNHFLNNITLIRPNSSTKATLLWREGNLGVLGCGVTRWQLRNFKKTRVKLYRTCTVVCNSHKRLDNKINVFLLQIPRKKAQDRPWWGVWPYIYTGNGDDLHQIANLKTKNESILWRWPNLFAASIFNWDLRKLKKPWIFHLRPHYIQAADGDLIC